MISELRSEFNRKWTDAAYGRLRRRLDGRCGTKIGFRVCETPVFVPAGLMRTMETSGSDIIRYVVSDADYRKASDAAIPAASRAPREDPFPLFASVDFAICRTEDGTLVPRLIELQGFPTLYAYQPVLCQEYGAAYDLPADLKQYARGMDADSYEQLFRAAVLGTRAPENVILLEIDPHAQKTLPDFLLTGRLCGIAIVNVRDIQRKGRKLYYTKGATRIPIDRIYNRIIPEDLERSGAAPPFRLDDDIDVEWAGHPNWFFRMSKFSLPFIRHPAAPKCMFLPGTESLPGDLSAWVLKPLFSFAGSGVTVAPARAALEAIPPGRRREYLLQERVQYAPVIDTPQGGTKAEVRILYIWKDGPVPVLNLVRLSRGTMMGVDQNKAMAWVGSSAGFTPP